MSKACAVIAATLLLPGCAYLGERGRDLGDIVRLEGAVGVGIQANVAAGELLHLGVGSSRRWSAGWEYGLPTCEKRIEDHFPLSYAWSVIEPDVAALHTLKWGEGPENPRHRCPVMAPGALSSGTVRKPAMQFWNLEVGVMALAVGVEAGVNPAELLDFVLGFLGIDIARDDDAEGRRARRLWIPAGPDLLSEP